MELLKKAQEEREVTMLGTRYGGGTTTTHVGKREMEVEVKGRMRRGKLGM